jgi:hypothetical protein
MASGTVNKVVKIEFSSGDLAEKNKDSPEPPKLSLNPPGLKGR